MMFDGWIHRCRDGTPGYGLFFIVWFAKKKKKTTRTPLGAASLRLCVLICDGVGVGNISGMVHRKKEQAMAVSRLA